MLSPMSFTRRHVLGLSAGIAAAATLAACGSNTGRPNEGGGGGDGETPSLTQWYHEYGEDGVQDAVTRYAEEYPDATVEAVWQVGDYDKLVPAALLGQDAPDVFEFANGPSLDMIKAGQVVDLTDVVGDARSDFPESILAPMVYEDKVWGIPQTVDMQMLYYRKSAVEAAGLAAPTTLAELVEVSQAVAGNGGGFFAGNDGGLGVLGQVIIWAAGYPLLNDDLTDAGWNDPAFAEAVSAFRDFYNSSGYVKAASADWSSPAPFINGECNLQWTGLWNLPQIMEAHGDDVGVIPFPAIGGQGETAVAIGAYSACVTANRPNVEAAKDFVRWLWIDQADKQVEFSTAFGAHIPARTSLAGEAEMLASGPGADAVEMVNQWGHGPDLFWSSPSSDAYSSALNNIVVRGADAAAEIQTAASAVSAELKRLNG
ncbi:ABC transporter substrate-binding protein [Parenemella sanctibonifatiensis]|uniref:ABC transporter substrate-binding protein n=2 Tax=Parenemella sanctibonifatiensis TaxID=2016505 RepID=A0A255EKE3_9ACTN|nr:ABC transporter substrate-binding protein [Parenemella sanctibonifatiensis]